VNTIEDAVTLEAQCYHNTAILIRMYVHTQRAVLCVEELEKYIGIGELGGDEPW
jgi:hypothetical protein